MKIKSKNHIVTPALILVMLVIILFLPIEIPYGIDSNGKIFPQREWIVSKGQDGRLMASLINHKKGISQSFNLNIFERGDAVSFNLNPNLSSMEKINAGDTVGSINSNELEKNLSELKGNLIAEKVLLAVTSSGEKESLIESEENRLGYAKERVKAQELIYNRNKDLFEKDIISEEEYEITESTLELYKKDVEIAEATLEAAKTGEKQELLDYNQARIEALKDQIDVLENRQFAFNFISPISGTISRSFSPDTLLIVSDQEEYVVFIPVLLEDSKCVYPGQNVNLFIPGESESIPAKILNLNNAVDIVGVNQVRIAVAVINSNREELMPGLLLKCNIDCGSRTILEFVASFFNQIFTY